MKTALKAAPGLIIPLPEQVRHTEEITATVIIEAACAAWGVPVKDVLSRKWTTLTSRARILAMVLVRELLVLSHADIGEIFFRDLGCSRHATLKMERMLRARTRKGCPREWHLETGKYLRLKEKLERQMSDLERQSTKLQEPSTK